VVVRLQLTVLLQDYAELLFDGVETHHPFLVDDRAVDVDGDLEGDLDGGLDLALDDAVDGVVDIYRLVDVDQLVQVHRSLHLNIHRLLHNLRRTGDPNLIRHLLLHLNNLLNNPLRPLDIFRHLNPHLHGFLNNDLLHRLLGHSSILVLQLFFEHFDLLLELVLVALKSVDEPVVVGALFGALSEVLELDL